MTEAEPADGALVGYARVSTHDQNPAMQVEALTAVGCVRVFQERASGARSHRPVLAQAIDYMRAGDVLVVWRLDRASRSVRDLLDLAETLDSKGCGLRSLTEPIDTTEPITGRFIFTLLAAVSQMEREIIRARTREGVTSARAHGRHPGRPAALTGDRAEAARNLLQAGMPIGQAAQTLGVGRSTLYRWLQAEARGAH